MYFSPRAGLVGAYLLFSLWISAAAPIFKEKQSISILSEGIYFPAPSILLPSIFVKDVGDSQVRPRELLDARRDSHLDVQDNIMERRGIFHAIKSKFQKAARAIKNVAKKAVGAVKKAVTKVGHFVKAHGALFGKVGLKAISTAEQAASKVVGEVPGYGKVVGQVMEVEGKVLSKVSNKIRVKTSKKVEDAMKGMDKAQEILEYVP